MEAQLSPLLPLIERERAAGRAFALAVVIHTRGSTYRKAGALMAIAADGDYAGLLSGGCLEADLREHALTVIATGRPQTVRYDTGGTEDALWGLGIGCEGEMRILLVRVGPEGGWQPIDLLARALTEHRPAAFGLVIDSSMPGLDIGTLVVPGTPVPDALRPTTEALLARATQTRRAEWLESAGARVLAVPLALPPRLLLLGGGPDALPIVDLAARLGWKVTVADHRPAYAAAERFGQAERVVQSRPEELSAALELDAYDAAVVMSHHLPSDESYLRALAPTRVGYVGLLGPALRRSRLLEELGPDASALVPRLRAPVGLDLGGRTPESIALAIVAEIHAWLYGRGGGRFGAERAVARPRETQDACPP